MWAARFGLEETALGEDEKAPELYDEPPHDAGFGVVTPDRCPARQING